MRPPNTFSSLMTQKPLALSSRRHCVRPAYRVTAVEDPTQALSTVEALQEESQHVDVMLTDLVMRDFTGLQLIDQLRNRDIVLPAIVISGMDEAEALYELLRRRRADYLRKPFRLQEVIQQVGRVLNKELAE